MPHNIMEEDMKAGHLRVVYDQSTLKCFRRWDIYSAPNTVVGPVILLRHDAADGRTLPWKILTNQGILFVTGKTLWKYTYDLTYGDIG